MYPCRQPNAGAFSGGGHKPEHCRCSPGSSDQSVANEMGSWERELLPPLHKLGMKVPKEARQRRIRCERIRVTRISIFAAFDLKGGGQIWLNGKVRSQYNAGCMVGNQRCGPPDSQLLAYLI